MDNHNADVGNRILTLRRDRGYSREKLSELADISAQFLADIEKGNKSMTVATLRKLSSALNVSTDYIVYGIEKKSRIYEVASIVDGLPEDEQENAIRYLRLFSEISREKEDKK